MNTQITRRNLLTNSAAAGAFFSASGAMMAGANAFGRSSSTLSEHTSCTKLHTEIADDLSKLAIDPSIDAIELNHCFKTAKCPKCATRIGVSH